MNNEEKADNLQTKTESFEADVKETSKENSEKTINSTYKEIAPLKPISTPKKIELSNEVSNQQNIEENSEIDSIDKLAEVLKKHELETLEYSSKNFSIKMMSRKNEYTQFVENQYANTYMPISQSQLPQNAIATKRQDDNIAQNSAALTQKEEVKKLQYIKASMVGKIYLTPQPNASQFVEIGDAIEVNDVVCIIEAMKVMNQVKSPLAGIVRKIFVEQGDPVEFGQNLIAIELK